MKKAVWLVIKVMDESRRTVLLLHEQMILIMESFLFHTQEKGHNMKNYLVWRMSMIHFHQRDAHKKSFVKRHVYMIHFGINVGSEINGWRPALIYKRSKKTYGEDVIVIPLTSIKETKQSFDEFDVEILEGVQTPSLANLRQIRCVSKKRMGQWIGKINNSATQDLIEMKLLAMLGIKKLSIE